VFKTGENPDLSHGDSEVKFRKLEGEEKAIYFKEDRAAPLGGGGAKL